MAIALPDLSKPHCDVLDDRQLQEIARSHLFVDAFLQDQLFNRLLERIDNPVFRHTRLFIPRSFEFAVAGCGGVRQNFHHEIRRSLNSAGRDDVLSIIQHNNQIGLKNVMCRKLNIVWCIDDNASFREFNLSIEQKL